MDVFRRAKTAILVPVSILLFFMLILGVIEMTVLHAAEAGSGGAAGNLLSNEMPEILTDQLVNAAMKSEEKYGVPASITLAQIILESSGDYPGGMSQLAYECKNLFGMKGKGPAGYKIYATTEVTSSGEVITVTARFRKYRNYQQSIDDHGELLTTGRYAAYTKSCKTPQQWAEAIQRAGYATDPNYAELLMQLIYMYDLERFDNGGMYVGDGLLKGSFIWPTVKNSVITSHFGNRNLDIGSKNHQGIDIGVYGDIPGAAIYAADGGKVEATGKTATAGNYVRIDHGNGIVTVYMHMQNNSICVRKGQRVSQGQMIGRMGSTGTSSGTHLHFEIRVSGVAVDPEDYISNKRGE